jgi:hypothetical protein
MKRRRALTFTVAAVVGLTTVLLSAPAAFGATSGAGKLGLDDPLCASQFSLCADSVGTLNGYYVGHDEPRSFKSNKPKKCVPDSDKNGLEGTNPKAANYIGKHPGNAFMELQFDGPGYVTQFEGFRLRRHSLLRGVDYRQPHARSEPRRCRIDRNRKHRRLQQLHPRRSRAHQLGVGHAERRRAGARHPLFTGTFADPNFSAVNPDLTKDLLMNLTRAGL